MPKQIAVNVSADHLRSLATVARPFAVISEPVWNGLDADAKHVQVRFDRNQLDTIERSRTLRNLLTLYRPLCGTVHFFNNSSDVPRLVFKDESGRTTVLDPALYEEILRSSHQ